MSHATTPEEHSGYYNEYRAKKHVPLWVRSVDRTSSIGNNTPSDFGVLLPEALAGKRLRTIRLIECQIPQVENNVTTDNNTVAVEEAATGAVWTFSLPSGNYTAMGLVNRLNEVFTRALSSPPASAAFDFFKWSFDYPTIRFRLEAGTGGNVLAFTVSGNISTLLGISGSEVNPTTQGYWAADNLPNLLITKFVHIQLAGVPSTYRAKTDIEHKHNRTLTSIPYTAGHGNYLSIGAPLHNSVGVHSEVRTLEIKLVKDDGSLLDTAGLDVEFLFDLVFY